MAGCSNEPRMSEKETVTGEVSAMLDAYRADVAAEGLRAEFRYLDSSDDFFWVPPGYSSALRYDSIRTILEMNAEAFRSVEFTWDTLRIIPLSRDLATYTGRIRSRMIDTNDVVYSTLMLETGLARRNDSGRWWILSGQSRVMDEE